MSNDLPSAAPQCAVCGLPPAVQWRRQGDVPGDTVAVFACSVHAITLAGAALLHEATCTAPVLGQLPACDCTPVSLAAPFAVDPTAPLSTGWVVPPTS